MLHDQNNSSPFFDQEWMFNVKNGFDIVIGNPPYFRYQESHAGEICELQQLPELDIAKGGKLNAYKLFFAKSLNILTAKKGFISLIFQNSFLADKSATFLRTHILEKQQIINVDSFPERDNVKKRVFEAVKMSVCIVLVQNQFLNDTTPFQLNVWSDKQRNRGYTVNYTPKEIKILSPQLFEIPSLTEFDKQILLKVVSQKNIFIKCYEGELNVTFLKKYFTDNSEFPVILKGASIQRYFYTNMMSQGKIEYLDAKSYHQNYGQSKKSGHHKYKRIVMQGISGVNDKKRLIMTIIPEGIYLANSCNYILPIKDIDLQYILALLNSNLINWFFKLFSTNSNVNGYEIDILPLKHHIKYSNKITNFADRIISVKKAEPSADTSALESEIDQLVYQLYDLTDEEIAIVEASLKPEQN